MIEVTALEQRERRVDILLEGAAAKQTLPEREGVAFLQDAKEQEDDWFVLLDVPIRQPSFVAPGRADFPLRSCCFFIHFLPQVSYSEFSVSLLVASMPEYVEAYARESVSTLTEAEAVDPRRELVVEDAVVEKVEAEPPKQVIPDVLIGICSSQMCFYQINKRFILCSIVARVEI